MAKVRINAVNQDEKYKIVGEFYDIVAGLKTKNEIIKFFVGIFTPSESLMIARRIQIAKLLLEGHNYEVIRKKLKVGFHTITQTHNWLNKDEEYHRWIEKCFKNKKFIIVSKNYATNQLDKYPGHRLLKELFL